MLPFALNCLHSVHTMNSMQRIIAFVLLGAALIAQAKPVPTKLVQNFAQSHSKNGNAVGVVSWTGKGAGKEVKLGECPLAAACRIKNIHRLFVMAILVRRASPVSSSCAGSFKAQSTAPGATCN